MIYRYLKNDIFYNINKFSLLMEKPMEASVIFNFSLRVAMYVGLFLLSLQLIYNRECQINTIE